MTAECTIKALEAPQRPEKWAVKWERNRQKRANCIFPKGTDLAVKHPHGQLVSSGWYSKCLDGCALQRNCNKVLLPPVYPIVLLSARGGGPLWETDTNFSDMKPVICVIPLEHSRRTCCIPTDQQRRRGGGGQALVLSPCLSMFPRISFFSFSLDALFSRGGIYILPLMLCHLHYWEIRTAHAHPLAGRFVYRYHYLWL